MKPTVVASAFLALAASAAHADSFVKIDGSSTVYPVIEAVAEEFQNSTKGAVKVTVGISGTGGGFKKFCRGEIDIAAASRPIKTEEMEACKAAGIEFIELPVALDATREWLGVTIPKSFAKLDVDAGGRPEGIVVSNQRRTKRFKLRFEDYDRTLG